MSKAKKLKSTAPISAPQTINDCAADIKKLGDLQRQQARIVADMNDAIAAITKQHQPELEALGERITVLQKGVEIYCTANRHDLTNGGKTKTANLVTGEVSWRQRPPSVSVRGVDMVLETLRRMHLEQFIRVKQEVNKDAILADQDAVRGIAGITIVSGVEDFAIVPFEVEASQA